MTRQRAIGQPALELHQQAARPHHVEQEVRHRLAGEYGAIGAQYAVAGQIDDDALALGDLAGTLAGHQQQADIEGVAEIQAAEAGRDHGVQAQLDQRGGGLLARRADAEIAARHQHVAWPHAAGEIGPHAFQAMAGDVGDAEFHVGARGELVGIDIVAGAPGFVGRTHASTSRGSAMRPASAAAATVYGEARYTWALAAPMRPLKLRAVVETTLAPSGIEPP